MKQQVEYKNECLITYNNITPYSYLIRSWQGTQYCYYYIYDKVTLEKIKCCPKTYQPIELIEKLQISSIPDDILKIIVTNQTLHEHDELIKIDKLTIDNLPWVYAKKRYRKDIINDLSNMRFELSKYENLKSIKLTKLKLDNAIFKHISMVDMDLSDSSLVNGKLYNVNLSGVNFYQVNLNKTLFAPNSLVKPHNLTMEQLIKAEINIQFLLNTLEQKIKRLVLPYYVQDDDKALATQNPDRFLSLRNNLTMLCKQSSQQFKKASNLEKANFLLSLSDLEYKLDCILLFIEQNKKATASQSTFNIIFGAAGFLFGAFLGLALMLSADTNYWCDLDSYNQLNYLIFKMLGAGLFGTTGAIGCRGVGNHLLKQIGFFKDSQLEFKRAREELEEGFSLSR